MRRVGHPVAIGAGSCALSGDPGGMRAGMHIDDPWTVRGAVVAGPDCASSIVPVALPISIVRAMSASA
jgi:hypothetical protein